MARRYRSTSRKKRVYKARRVGRRRYARRITRRKKKKTSISKRLVRRQNYKTQVPHFAGYQPKTKRITLKYANIQGIIGLTAPNSTTYTFMANGLFDPLQQTGGHQPMLFDQMCLLYTEYKVIGAKIRFTEQIGASVGQIGTDMFYLYVDGASDTFSTVPDDPVSVGTMLEQGYIRVRDILQFPINTKVQQVRPIRSLNASWKLSTYKSVLNETDPKDFWIPCSANPNGTTQPLFHFHLMRNNNILSDFGVSANPARVPADSNASNFYMEIEYDCLFRDPIQIIAS